MIQMRGEDVFELNKNRIKFKKLIQKKHLANGLYAS